MHRAKTMGLILHEIAENGVIDPYQFGIEDQVGTAVQSLIWNEAAMGWVISAETGRRTKTVDFLGPEWWVALEVRPERPFCEVRATEANDLSPDKSANPGFLDEPLGSNLQASYRLLWEISIRRF